MQVQHPAPTAVHDDDSSCFQEEEKNHKAPVQEDVVVPGTEVVEEAPSGAKEPQLVHANGVAEEETAKAHDEEDSDDKENNPTDDHEDADECLVQAVAQEVDAKLGAIVQDDVAIVNDSSAPAVDDEAKVPKEEEAEEPRREVTRKAARAAKAVVVPVDDDYDGLVNGEATAPPSKAAPEAPAEKEEDEEANKEG
jgi:hypothetical protein